MLKRWATSFLKSLDNKQSADLFLACNLKTHGQRELAVARLILLAMYMHTEPLAVHRIQDGGSLMTPQKEYYLFICKASLLCGTGEPELF
jgi:hypothetical protein